MRYLVIVSFSGVDMRIGPGGDLERIGKLVCQICVQTRLDRETLAVLPMPASGNVSYGAVPRVTNRGFQPG